ncbi:hypothetical protein BP6252_05643 [Coleophoma cylindrospora]|uniref:Transmembrane protein n=1 Tax=Coleophoma cylindrospora TaxID=1849047 RepID=A0A3D8RUG4_9HELO|nr:hypothetical protein BP6252_05643 [Coleophoma cylindrospora]
MLGRVSAGDAQLSGLAAGFSIGFGIWTTTCAIRQTKRCKNPRRSLFLYMVWGEILANLFMGILAWLAINKVIAQSLTFFIAITTCWVFELHLYFQIIINRCGVVADDKDMIRRLKIITAALIFLINISVYTIWIPSQLDPPPFQILVIVNKYWDRTTKGILMAIDICLNYYFLRVVQQRLVKNHGLIKYKPLVHFNAWLMVVSLLMDALLIGLESVSLKNHSVVFDQFHPLVYLVKLHIELSMADLITKLAKSSAEDRINDFYNSNHDREFLDWNRPRLDSDPAVAPPAFLRRITGDEKRMPVLNHTTSRDTGYAEMAPTRSSTRRESQTTATVSVTERGEEDTLLVESSKLK